MLRTFAEEIKDRVTALNNQIRIYNPKLSSDFRSIAILEILSRTSDLQASLHTNITKGHFWDLLSDYLFVINIRLTFLTEQALVQDNGHDASSTVASEVLYGLQIVRQFLRHDFIDHTLFQCIYKQKKARFYNSVGVDIKQKYVFHDDGKAMCRKDTGRINSMTMVERPPHKATLQEIMKNRFSGNQPKNSSAPDMSRTPTRNQLNNDFWKNRRVFRRPGKQHTHEFYFTYKGSPSKNEYWMGGPYITEQRAEQRRIAFSIDKYPSKLGNIKKILHDWQRILHKTGDDRQKRLGDAYYVNMVFK